MGLYKYNTHRSSKKLTNLLTKLLTNFDLNTFKSFASLSQKWFQLCHSKISKERKNVLFEGS